MDAPVLFVPMRLGQGIALTLSSRYFRYSSINGLQKMFKHGKASAFESLW